MTKVVHYYIPPRIFLEFLSTYSYFLSYFRFRSVFNSGIICHAGPNCQLLSLRGGPTHQSAVSTKCQAPHHPPPGCHGATLAP
jgi:hypothetical protein